MEQTQTARGACPDTPSLILANGANRRAGQPFFRALLDPRALEISVQAVVRADPHISVKCPQQGVNSIEPPTHCRPVPAVKFPDFILSGAPDFAFCDFEKSKRVSRRGLIVGMKCMPFSFMVPSGAMFAADPKI